MLLAGDVPTFAIRTDLLSAPPGELAFLYAYGMAMARRQCVGLASTPEDVRPLLIPALIAAMSTGDSQSEDSASSALASRISEVLNADELKAWGELLGDGAKAIVDAQTAFVAVERAACRVALVAAGDLRTATRAMARISPDNKRPPGVAKIEDFEAFYASIPPLASLFEFALSDEFGRLIRAAG